MKFYRKLLNIVLSVFEAAAAVMLSGMVLLVCYHVFMRYVLNATPAWTEEIALQLMIWFCFISMALGVKNKAHLAIEAFVGKLPSKPLFIVNLFDKIATLVFGGLMGYFIIPYVVKLMGNRLPATGMRTGYQYLVAIIIGVLVVALIIEQIITQFIEGREQEAEKEVSNL